jgi:hypothetical protein
MKPKDKFYLKINCLWQNLTIFTTNVDINGLNNAGSRANPPPNVPATVVYNYGK